MSTTRTTRIILTTATWLGWSALVAGLLAGGSRLVGALSATPPPEATPVATAGTSAVRPLLAVAIPVVPALPPAAREELGALGEAAPAAGAPASGQRVGGQRTRAIEALVPGDWVLARNEQTGEVTPRRVLRVFRRVVDHVRRVRVRPAGGGDVQEVRTTEEHPFWVPGQGWVAAGRLQPGDRLLQADGRTAVVEASRFVRQPGGQVVHNLEVEGDHCYAVRAGGSAAELVWVHNSRECLPDSPGTGPITDPRRMLPAPVRTTASPGSFRQTHTIPTAADRARVAQIEASMRQNGWVGDPITVVEHNGQRYILDGHHRVAAAARAGIDVPYRAIPASKLPAWGYRTIDEVIWAYCESLGR